MTLYLSSDGVGAEKIIKNYRVRRLKPGETKTYRFNYSIRRFSTAATNFILAVIDPTNAIEETNKRNNSMTVSIQ